MPKVVDGAEQRREIRNAARRVFAQRGVRGTGLTHVAEAAGMGRSSLYYYYPDKGALVRDLLRDLLAGEEALFVGAARAPGSPRARLDALAGALPAAFEEWTQVGRLLAELRATDARRFRRFFHRIRTALADLVAEGQRAGEFESSLDPNILAATIIGAIDGVLIQLLVDPQAFADRRALFAGLAASLRRMVVR